MTGNKDHHGFVMSIIEKVGKGMGKDHPAFKKSDPSDSSDDDSEDDDKMAEESAGTDLAAAIKDGDGNRIADAFEALLDLLRPDDGNDGKDKKWP